MHIFRDGWLLRTSIFSPCAMHPAADMCKAFCPLLLTLPLPLALEAEGDSFVPRPTLISDPSAVSIATDTAERTKAVAGG